MTRESIQSKLDVFRQNQEQLDRLPTIGVSDKTGTVQRLC